ncbi:elongator complex protein 5 [Anopheles nili]|uniref:elongator complex protein 5 n=1 Tax=Anopheles nili TaxID=185578 RepID=UPI00237C199C|nr:elongator complex protein 5 [Anopheles nili]
MSFVVPHQKRSHNLIKNVQLLSNLALPQQKVIVIHDKIGLEPMATELITKWLQEQRDKIAFPCGVNLLNEFSEFLLIPISRLERRFKPSELFQYVAQCKKKATVVHAFVWISEPKLQQAFLLPYLEHMADTVITFEDSSHISLLVKKRSGKVTNKYYIFDYNNGSVTVVEEKHPSVTRQPTSDKVDPTPNPAALGTFKIDLKDEEVAAKNALTLPFEFYKSTPEGGKILYHPDAEDDLDEEDPDDDLLI